MNTPTFETVSAYIKRLPNTEAFESLKPEDKQKRYFEATEKLKGHFSPTFDPVFNDRVIALQVISNMATDGDGFNQLRKQGIHSYSVKDSSVTFSEGASDWDAEIIALLNDLNPTKRKRARLGRLV